MSPATRGPSGPARGTKARAARLAGTTGSTGTSSTDTSSTATAPEKVPNQATAGATTARRSDGERELSPDELAALEEERTFLLDSLRDLEAEHDAGDVDDVDFAALQDDYTARAAAVIRAIDGHHALVASRRPPRSWGRRLGVVALVVLLAVGAGLFVARSAGQRNGGDTVSGGTRQSTRDQLLQARQMLATQNYDGAIKIYDQVLQSDPANVEALSYRGWMYRLKALSSSTSSEAVPLLTEAIKSLHDALAVKPDDGTSLVFLAVLYGDLQQPQQALDTLAKVPAGSVPDFMAGTVDSFRSQMQAMLAGGSTTTTG